MTCFKILRKKEEKCIKKIQSLQTERKNCTQHLCSMCENVSILEGKEFLHLMGIQAELRSMGLELSPLTPSDIAAYRSQKPVELRMGQSLDEQSSPRAWSFLVSESGPLPR